MIRRIALTTFAVALGCEVKNVGELDTSNVSDTNDTESSGGESSSSSSADSMTSVDSGGSGSESESSTGAPACEAVPDISVAFELEAPPPATPPNEEADSISRTASCVVDTITPSGVEQIIELTCDEAGGQTGASWVLRLALSDIPPAPVDVGDTVDLTIDEWWGFEVGSGRHLRLDVDGAPRLLAYSENVFTSIDAVALAGLQADAEQWFSSLAMRVVPRACADEGSFLLEFLDAPPIEVEPGSVVDLPTTPAWKVALAETATWRLDVIAWRLN